MYEERLKEIINESSFMRIVFIKTVLNFTSRKVQIALFILTFSTVCMFTGILNEALYASILGTIFGGYSLVNLFEKRGRK